MTCAVAEEARQALSQPHVNYFQLQTLVKTLDQRVHEATADTLTLLHTCKQEILEHLDELKLHSQWQKLGHNTDFITTHPECVKFLLESGIAFQIAGLHNSCIRDSQKHTIEKDSDGHPLLLLEAKLTRWEIIKEKFNFLKYYHVLTSKSDPSKRWTYTSYAGITAADIYHFQHPFHVYELEEHHTLKLQTYARQFYPDNKPDPSAKYVLQICTSLGKLCARAPSFLKNFGKKLASHYAIRIITPEGKVFSFGLRRDIGELDSLDITNALGQVKGRIAMNDYDELRPHSGRYITTIPLSQKAATTILEDIATSNQQTPVFDYFEANCVELATRCLKVAGIDVDTNECMEGCIQDIALSFFKNIPYLGACVRKVRHTTKTLFASIPAMPECLKDTCTIAIKVVTYIPTKISAICKNLLVWSMGWAYSSPALSALRQTRSLTCFDFLNEDLSNLRYPRHLLRWQKLQTTTYCHEYEGCPQLAILPPHLVSSPR